MQTENSEIINNFFKKTFQSEKDPANLHNCIGYSCTYIPEEILISGNLNAIRIKGDINSRFAEGYLPVNFCPYIKAIWEEAHKKSKFPGSIIFATSCDGMRRLYDLFSVYNKETPSFILDVPRNYDKNSCEFFKERLKKLLEFVKSVSSNSNINSKDLIKSVAIINNKRKLLSQLTLFYESDSNNFISTSQYFKIMDLAVSTENKIFIPDIENFIKNFLKITDNEEFLTNIKNSANNLKIMVIGNYINDEKFWEIFSDLNIKVISGDLCASSRYFDFQINLNDLDIETKKCNLDSLNEQKNKENDEDYINIILDAIARGYLKKPFCFRMTALNEKLNSIKNTIISKKINAVIFASLKFCDNTLYFYPELKKELEKLNIPSLFLDIEYGSSSLGQIRTRIEAFYEMLT
ncbi:MAG: 2-hydroxyacyl-CoA dehydratase family protein [Actinobacteria bacterium]|nr:2-hydroxyacyl-CoA dehydratase family protein [Actinomycetota bacterium]